MSKEISTRRREMGEEKWIEYQKQRMLDKTKAWKARNVDKVIDWRRRTKEKLVVYKGGKCAICGYCKPYMSCYDFHHRDPSEKEFSIGASGKIKSFEKLKAEADKCMLLCRNCHSEIHDKEYAQQREESKQRYREWLESRLCRKQCPECKNIFQPKRNSQKYCGANCLQSSALSRRKVERPLKEQLEKMVWEMPTTKIAHNYNVSDKSVEKWCKSYDIIKPPRGYWTVKKGV